MRNSAVHIPEGRHLRGPRIGLDCLALPGRPTGAGTYMLSLARSLLQQAQRSFPITVFCKTAHSTQFLPWLGPGDRICTLPVLNRAHLLFAYEFLLPTLLIQQRIRLFHATHYLAPPPPPGVSVVLTIHDLGLYLHPRYYPWSKRLYLRSRMATFLRRARQIIAVSRTTARHLRETFPSQANKIRVVYHGTDHLPEPASTPAHPPPGSQPFLLAVNAFEPRKNISFLISVFEELKLRYKMPHKLVLAGYPANGLNEIRARCKSSPVASHIQLRLSPDEQTLVWLYHRADAFLSASLWEGFGLTPFEALRCGRPVYLYANEVVRELLPASPALFPRLDSRMWAERIFRDWLAGFPERPDSAVLNRLTWQRCARQTARIYQHCLFPEKEGSLVY